MQLPATQPSPGDQKSPVQRSSQRQPEAPEGWELPRELPTAHLQSAAARKPAVFGPGKAWLFAEP